MSRASFVNRLSRAYLRAPAAPSVWRRNMDGSEDGSSRTSEALILANRASRGLRVGSAPFLYWTDTSGPRVSRTVGALDADPEGLGEG